MAFRHGITLWILLAGLCSWERGVRSQEILNFDYEHRIFINDEETQAIAQGTINLDTGELHYDSQIERYIVGYARWAASPVTKATHSGGPIGALTEGEAQNLFALTNGELGYEIVSRTLDEFADIETRISVLLEGDTVVARLESQGNADYPVLVGIDGPVVFTQMPIAGGFLETGIKRLVTEDGSIIESLNTAEFLGVELPFPQVREVGLTVLAESEDSLELTIRLDNVVRPLEVRDETIYRGLRNRALGEAQLTRRGDRLTVSNLGASGEDGLGIDLGPGLCDYLIVGFETPLPEELPDGAAMTITTNGTLDGDENQFIWSLRVEDVGDEFGVSIDTRAVRPEELRVEARRRGEVVASQVLEPTEDIIVRFPPEACWVDPFWQMLPECWAIFEFPSEVEVGIENAEAVLADQLVIATVNQEGVVTALSDIRMQASDIPRFEVFDEFFGLFENEHRARGQATYAPEGDRLTITNIGSSGMDGVSVLLDDATGRFSASLAPVQLLSEGAALHVSAVGALDGVANTFLGSATVAGSATGLSVLADYRPIQSDEVEVVVANGGRVVGRATVPSGELAARLSPVPGGRLPRIIDCGKLPPRLPIPPNIPWPPFPPCIIFEFDTMGVFQLIGGDAVEGDGIRLLAANARGNIDSIQRFDLCAEGIGEFTLLDENFDSLVFDGLVQRPLGGATIGRRDGHLTVSNIGSSGEDGLAIDIGGADCDYLIVGFETPEPEFLPDGAAMTITTNGTLDGNENQFVWSLRVEDVGDEFGVSIDTSAVRPEELRVEARRQGEVVASQVFEPSDEIIVRFPPEACWVDPFWQMLPECWAIFEFPSEVEVTIGDGDPVAAEQVVIATVNQEGIVSALSDIRMQASDIPRFEVFEELFGLFENEHHALGGARFVPNEAGLTMSGIGVRGDDGVAIQLNDSTGVFRAALSPLDLNADGAVVRLAASGSFGGIEDTFLGSLEVANAGGELTLSADYSAIDAQTIRIQAFEGGALTGEVDVVGSEASAIIASPNGRLPDLIGCGKGPPVLPCIIANFDDVIGLLLGPEGGVAGGLSGDEIRVLAIDAPNAIDSLSEFEITGRSLNFFTLLDESECEPSEPGGELSCNDGLDNDCDGLVDQFDRDCPTGESFVRGDADSDDFVTITDGIHTLNFLFAGGPAPACLDAADTDDSNRLNIVDAVRIFTYLFLGGRPPEPPSPSAPNYAPADCGPDPNVRLGCATLAPKCS